MNITASNFEFGVWMSVIYIVEQNVKYRQVMFTTGFILLIIWKPPL